MYLVCGVKRLLLNNFLIKYELYCIKNANYVITLHLITTIIFYLIHLHYNYYSFRRIFNKTVDTYQSKTYLLFIRGQRYLGYNGLYTIVIQLICRSSVVQ